MSTALVIPCTVTGTGEIVRVLLPSWPHSLRPQHFTVPSEMTAQLCQRPVAIFTAPDEIPLTATGYSRFEYVLSPNCPYAFHPQQATPPVAVTPHVWRSPDSMLRSDSPSMVSVVETRDSANSPVSACTAVTVAVPADATEICPVEAFHLATAVFELSYDQAPGLSDVGAVGVNAGDENVFGGMVNVPTVARRRTRMSVVVVALPHVPLCTCVAVRVAEPRPTTVTSPVAASIVATDVSLLVYVKAPGLFEVGRVGVKGASPSAFVIPIPA